MRGTVLRITGIVFKCSEYGIRLVRFILGDLYLFAWYRYRADGALLDASCGASFAVSFQSMNRLVRHCSLFSIAANSYEYHYEVKFPFAFEIDDAFRFSEGRKFQ